MSDTVLLQISDGIALLTLNRPAKLNALNYELIDWLLGLLDMIEVNDTVGAVIITGAGERAFSAGGDIPEFSGSVAKGANTAVRDFVRRGQRLTARLEAFPKPIIAAVNGLAYGGGCKSPRPCILPLPAIAPVSPSPRSGWACRRPLAAPSACPGLPAANARWNCF